MRKSTIYTGSGDSGTTGLANGERLEKTDQRLVAIGSVDELNALLGVSIAALTAESEIKNCLTQIQNHLFSIGAALALAPDMTTSHSDIEQLEDWIDRYDAELPQLRHFILPGGSAGGAFLHQTRTVCRRAEREILHLAAHEEVESNLCIYLNRLSDLLFVLARFSNQLDGHTEQQWIPK